MTKKNIPTEFLFLLFALMMVYLASSNKLSDLIGILTSGKKSTNNSNPITNIVNGVNKVINSPDTKDIIQSTKDVFTYQVGTKKYYDHLRATGKKLTKFQEFEEGFYKKFDSKFYYETDK